MFDNYFEFYNPVKILCGHHSLENIPYELERMGAERTMIFVSRTMRESGILEMIGGRYHAMIESDLPPKASFSLVNELTKKARNGGCDSILAIGGGSIIDAAKAVRAMLSSREPSLRQLLGSEWPDHGKHIPFIAVPTTSGTGSECTASAIIWDEETQRLQEMYMNNFLPDAAVIDPRSTQKLPLRLTASCGIDALAQSIEAYTGLQHNPLSDAYARSAVRMIGQNLLAAVRHPKNDDYRIAMACASAMAGIALSNSMAGLVHAAAHALEMSCQLPHSEAVGLMLPKVMRWQMDVSGERYGELLCDFCGTEYYAEVPYRQRGEKLVEAIEDTLMHLHQKCEIPVTFADAGVSQEQLNQAARIVKNDGELVLNAKRVSAQDLTALFSR